MNDKEQLLKAQQGELDAVLLYKALAKRTKNSEVKARFEQVASDEGKHAAILRGYTNHTLQPRKTKARVISLIYVLLGHSFTCKLLMKGELASVPGYMKLVGKYPKIQEIIEDERRHADIAKNLLKSV